MYYQGDRAEPYDPETGTGLIGKVMRGDKDRWYRVVEAKYDPETDRTKAKLQRIISPQQAAAEMGVL